MTGRDGAVGVASAAGPAGSVTSSARSSNSVAWVAGSSTVHVPVGRARFPRRLEVELGLGVRRRGAFEHVDDDHGHVVPPALAVGEGDELVGRALGVGDRWSGRR